MTEQTISSIVAGATLCGAGSLSPIQALRSVRMRTPLSACEQGSFPANVLLKRN
jgi:hypothetical protein